MATIVFRDFEPRDLGFIHKCKTDAKLNSLVVGDWKPFTLEQSKAWLDGCIRADNPAYKFWAIATNDEEKRIVGWCSLSEIDLIKKRARFHSIVIADPDYHDGIAWIETNLFVYNYAFEKLKLDNIYGSALTDHVMTQTMRKIMFCQIVEIKKNAIYRNGEYHDISVSVLTSDNYFWHKAKGDYEISAILKHLRQIKKTK